MDCTLPSLLWSLLWRTSFGVGLALLSLPLCAAPPPSTTTVTVTDSGGARQTLTGTVLVEAQDGSLLLETAIQQLHLLAGDTIRDRRTDEQAETLSPRALGQQVLTEFPERFSLLTTRHYVICYDTSAGYARWAAALFERLYSGFHAFWKQQGMDLTPPEHPLVVVIFSDRRAYMAAAAREVGEASHSIVGYYNQLSNRITTFDLTGSDSLGNGATASAGRAGTEILASPEAAGLVATLIHEATHQLAFNAGLQQRLAPIPVWVSEGIATYFETPDLTSSRGWRSIGSINRPRLDLIRRRFTPGLLTRMITSDEPFRDPDEALVAYAHAWALVSMLAKTKRIAFADYMRVLAAKRPLASDTPAERLADFETTFGESPDALEKPLIRYLSGLPVR